MREVKTICDVCGQVIDALETPCALYFQSSLGHNQVPADGWHFHYNCFREVLNAISAVLIPPPRSHASYCGLRLDHEGQCSAMVTRIAVPESNIRQ